LQAHELFIAKDREGYVEKHLQPKVHRPL